MTTKNLYHGRQYSDVVLMGDPGVGKTSLVHSLLEGIYDPQQRTTSGLPNNLSLELTNPVLEDVTMRIRIWDYAAQTVEPISQIPISDSIILLVWSALDGYEQGRLEYWLDTIRKAAAESPVLLVATHIDLHEADLPLENFRRRYPTIAGFHSVSNLNKTGIEELRLNVAELAAGLHETFTPALDIQPRVVADIPSETDVLGFEPLVNALHALLNDSRTSLPFAIALNAPWGSGKSSIMLQLKRRLLNQATNGSSPSRRVWYTVDFPAWKFEKSERLWAALAKAIYDQPQRQMSFLRRSWFRLQLEWGRLGGWRFVGLNIGLPAGVAVLVATLLFFGSVAEDLPAWVATTGSGGGLAALLFTAWARFSGLLGSPFKRGLEAYVNRPKYHEQLGFTTEAESDIRHLIDGLTAGENHALAIFVDDLDRCSSRHVVEVVEAINQIFNSVPDRRCVFILGLDSEVVASSIDVEYSDMLEYLRNERHSPLAEDYGYKFLSKIVQMSVTVPAPTADAMSRLLAQVTESQPPALNETNGMEVVPPPMMVTNFREQFEAAGHTNPFAVSEHLRRLEETAKDSVERRAMQEASRIVRTQLLKNDSQDVREAEFEALKFLDRNPRQVKRFDNAFRLQLHLASSTSDLAFNRDQIIALARWVILRLRWPRVAQELDREPDMREALNRLADEPPTSNMRPDSYLGRYKALVSATDQDDLIKLLQGPIEQRIASLPLDLFLRVA